MYTLGKDYLQLLIGPAPGWKYPWVELPFLLLIGLPGGCIPGVKLPSNSDWPTGWVYTLGIIPLELRWPSRVDVYPG